MYLQRLLQVSIALFVTLGSLLLCLGQRNVLYPLIVLVACMLSVWVTDVAGWFRLNRSVSNVFAVAAMIVFGGQLLTQLSGSYKLYAVANLLIYFQLILLFQEKRFRTYALLASLSLAEVIVATAYSQSVAFGFLLIVYLAAGAWALTLLFLHHERLKHHARPEPTAPESPADERWPMLGQPCVLVVQGAGAVPSGLGMPLWFTLARVVVSTVVFSILLFFCTPRLGEGAWRGGGMAVRTVGYSNRVKLGELGTALEDPQEVLRIEFSDLETGQIYRVGGELYLRGAVLGSYEDGEWRSLRQTGAYRSLRTQANPGEKLVRQVIKMEPTARPEIFCVWPVVALKKHLGVVLYLRRERLLRQDEAGASESCTYELGTTGLSGNVQSPLVPCELPPPSLREWDGSLGTSPQGEAAQGQQLIEDVARYLSPYPEFVHPLLQMPEGKQKDSRPLAGLARLAEEWATRSKLPPHDARGLATLFERRLRDSGEFRYSLQGQSRDPTLDPLEDFVTHSRVGHCEYFASALAMMLRSRGIPARVIVGFKTDEWNRVANFWQVRQLHAHTWVEAYLARDQISDYAEGGPSAKRWRHGGWLRLDPTPAASQQLSEFGTMLRNADNYLSWLDSIWDAYIMDMDNPRQRESVYDPMLKSLRRLLAPRQWLAWRNQLRQQYADTIDILQRTGWLAWWRALLVVEVLLVGLEAGLLLRRLKAKPGRRRRAAARAAAAAWAQVRFYRRLEAVLARYGRARAPTQTQREFARKAGSELFASDGQAELAPLPLAVAEAFYQVRFGAMPLDSTQAQQVEQSLAQLEHATTP